MFITLEGPEGSGKTSHVPHLVEYLREKGYTIFPTREPGGTSIGEQIREVLHSLKNTEVVRARLAVGEIVLSDRYADSTIAYQGYGHQQDLEQVRTLVKYATGGLVPDLTVLLDVDIEIGIGRKSKSQEWNRLDAYTLEFHQRVRRGYFEMVKREPERWVVVDAGKDWNEVQQELRKVILDRLEK
jgi:dTMP kinase